MCMWLAVRRVAVSNTRPVCCRLHECKPAEHFEAVTCPRSVLGKLLWHDILHADVDFADRYEPEEHSADTIAHGGRTRIVVPTVKTFSQFIQQTHFTVAPLVAAVVFEAVYGNHGLALVKMQSNTT